MRKKSNDLIAKVRKAGAKKAAARKPKAHFRNKYA